MSRFRLIILDRDGVLNQDSDAYIKSPDELILIPGSATAVARLNRTGAKLAVASNQSAVGRGMITPAMLERIHAKLTAELAAAGGRLDLLLVATDHPDRPTERRKPAPGMLLEAMAAFAASPAETLFVGDQSTDVEAARRAGIACWLVETGKGRTTAARHPELPAFADLAHLVDRLAQ